MSITSVSSTIPLQFARTAPAPRPGAPVEQSKAHVAAQVQPDDQKAIIDREKAARDAMNRAESGGAQATTTSNAMALTHRAEALAASLAKADANAQPKSELTFEGLLEAWGQSDSPYDLNGDGTVGVGDLLMLLGQLDDEKSQQLEGQVLDLLAQWGQNGSQFDLNGDGTVGVADLLMLLQQAAGPGESDQDSPPFNPTLEGLLEAWGQSDSPYDLNGDGTVGVGDLLMLLGQLDGQKSQQLEGQVLDLLAQWGQNGSQFDLNGDGTVGIADLLMLLQQAAGEPNQPPPFNPTLEGLLEAWGQSDSPYDLNGDGTVGVGDLLLLLSQLEDNQSQQPGG